MFVFSVIRLVSRRCHNISAIHQLYPSPSQNRTSSFPTSGSSLKHSVAGGTVPPWLLSVFGLFSQVMSRIESCLCFSSHGCLSAGTFTPRGLAASPLNRFPSRYGVTICEPSFTLARHTRATFAQERPRTPGLLHYCCSARCCLRPRGLVNRSPIARCHAWPAR